MTCMIDSRTERLIVTKDPIYPTAWVMYQNAFLVCMTDVDFRFPSHIHHASSYSSPRSTDCSLIPPFQCSTREVHGEARGTSSRSWQAYKLHDSWAHTGRSSDAESGLAVKYRHWWSEQVQVRYCKVFWHGNSDVLAWICKKFRFKKCSPRLIIIF